jgi:hypothetical protein
MNRLSIDGTTRVNDQLSFVQASGQTVVIFAIMLVALVALVGIAVDVGFGFVRSSQFSAAVDAAALAGVVDLDPHAEIDTSEADIRAQQFLAANGWPVNGDTIFVSGRAFTNLGIPNYTITVTWPVESFFMRIFGIEGFPVTRSATAAYFAQAEMYTVTAYERSHARKASLFIFGPQACTREGDPVSPRLAEPGQPNEGYHIANGIYRFAFRIPENYPRDYVRVEIFDPDSVNLQAGTIHTITHSSTYASTGVAQSPGNCSGSGNGQLCVLPTGENLESVFHNPYWFVRVDETWDGNCNPVASNRNGNTATTFDLYYFDAQGQRVPLARYAETNDLATVPFTDMRWVSPGAPGRDFIPTEFGSFEVLVESIPEGMNNARYIYLDVKAESGNSKNVFDVRAGRPSDDPDLPNDWLIFNHINERNLTLANLPALDASGGVETFALGRMPIQAYYGNALMKIPLVPVSSSLVDSVIYATMFDHDHSIPPPEIEFTIDSVAPSDFRVLAKVTDDPSSLPSYGIASLCNGGLNCNNTWIWPQFRIGVPTYMFRSGILFGQYYPHRDAHTWSVSITAGRPVLTR